MSFTPENRAKAREIVALYPYARSATLPLLHLAQEQDGWVTNEAVAEVADLVGADAAQVHGVRSFYTMYKREGPVGFVVSVCTNVTCLVTGGPELYETLAAEYADQPEVLVEEVECLAACDCAPVFQVNYDFHGPATPESARAVIEEYRSGVRTPRGVSGGRRA